MKRQNEDSDNSNYFKVCGSDEIYCMRLIGIDIIR